MWFLVIVDVIFGDKIPTKSPFCFRGSPKWEWEDWDLTWLVSASEDSDPEQGFPSLTSTGTATLCRQWCQSFETSSSQSHQFQALEELFLTSVATIRPLPVSQSLPSPSPVACACNGGSGTRSSPAAESFSFAACLLLFLKLLLGLAWFGFGLVWFGLFWWGSGSSSTDTSTHGREKEMGNRANMDLSFKYILLQWEIEFQIYSSTMGNRVSNIFFYNGK